ncbi:hypothetical protein AA0113_g6160 [Alternaria arborescens]|uniref:Uncharacterized protein n=4 Tax=Alternaria sect. Alternaria TaxID=2499237 RepID=A0A4Q4N4D8_ALTAL|nr:hypothetical protein AG0111_0g10567 [Alternaria gaisen]RYN28531.1 hypothetical protein AA0112_g7446 [Alternaria arborescens]RYN51805.1 hypothetical protein AA0114_g5392 [Alternaria tenuissima]RYN70233.1 hypothetical protein AA0117_g10703 [Alternaria alternata]RYN63662.1 hypothetical protein AA0118_g4406 [Alternaria tenuissima]
MSALPMFWNAASAAHPDAHGKLVEPMLRDQLAHPRPP